MILLVAKNFIFITLPVLYANIFSQLLSTLLLILNLNLVVSSIPNSHF